MQNIPTRKKPRKMSLAETDFRLESAESDTDETAFDPFDDWDNTKHEQQREQAKLKKTTREARASSENGRAVAKKPCI